MAAFRAACICHASPCCSCFIASSFCSAISAIKSVKLVGGNFLLSSASEGNSATVLGKDAHAGGGALPVFSCHSWQIFAPISDCDLKAVVEFWSICSWVTKGLPSIVNQGTHWGLAAS